MSPSYCQVCGKDDCCLASDNVNGMWHCTDCCNHSETDFPPERTFN